MCLHISSRDMISDIQEKFHQVFPDLKIEFLFKGNEKIRPINGQPHVYPYMTIEDLCLEPHKSELDIEDDMTVAQVEKLFQELFDLPAQVYSRTGDYWAKSRSLDDHKLKS